MIPLSLARINTHSPYQVSLASKENFFEFITVHGVHYSVGFMPDNMTLMPIDEAYHFIVANVNQQKSPNDVKVRDTIMSIVEEFFFVNNTTLLYICETGDGKQALRNRLFERWFSSFKQKALFTFITSSIVDIDGQVNFATIIIRNDYPHFSQVVQQFTLTVQILSQKPD